MSDDLLKRMGSFVSNHCLHADCSACELVAQAMFEIERLSKLTENAASVAECAFDDRPRSRVGHPSQMDWEDGYREGTQAASAALRARARARSAA